ncbi:hypothetical protein KKC44_02565 [Patescibacteria group bacterium]|nr:hypothetical protein [Patescibacteria group bacterium]
MDRPYEPPENPDLVIDDDRLSIEEARSILIAYLRGLEVQAVKPREAPEKKFVAK